MAYSKGIISIPSVSGNISITVTTEQKQSIEIPITWKVGKKCNYAVGETLTFSDAIDYSVSDFIAVTPNADYILKNLDDDKGFTAWSSFRVIGCNDNDVIIEQIISQSGWIVPASNEFSISIPANCTKIIIRPYNGGEYPVHKITLWEA